MRMVVRTSKVVYDFDLERSLSVIRGESGTGKSMLCELIDMYALRNSPSVRVECEVPVMVAHSKLELSAMTDPCLIVIDENLRTSTDVLKHLRANGCWVLLITRNDEMNIECASRSIYTVHTSGKYKTLKRLLDFSRDTTRSSVLAEDKKSGFKFFRHLGAEVASLDGKDNLKLKSRAELKDKLLVMDLAVAGQLLLRIYSWYVLGEFDVLDIDSFEEMLIHSNVFEHDTKVQKIIADPASCGANDPEYYSWESFYEHELNEALKSRCHVTYSKSSVPKALLADVSKILDDFSIRYICCGSDLEINGYRFNLAELKKKVPEMYHDELEEFIADNIDMWKQYGEKI